MEGQYKINRFSGNVLIVKNNAVLMHRAFGQADLEWNVANTTDTKFGLASISKQFTAVAVLQLVDKGALTLQDRLSKFFPGYPHGENISIHMILTHTAGLPLDFEELYLSSTELNKDTVLNYIKSLPLQFQPGNGLAYSNVGYYLLGQIIEKVSGSSLSDFLKNNIFEPAGMKNTGLNSNERIIVKLARSYLRTDANFLKNPYINWEVNTGLDGMYATASDLFKFNKALHGGKLLSDNLKTKMFTHYNKAYPDGKFLDTYGYGIFINPYFNQGHQMFTHSGGYFGVMTTMDYYPKDDLFITVLSNNESESHWIAYGLAGIMFGKQVETPYKHIEKKIDPRLLTNYIGKFGDVEFIKKENKLVIKKGEVVLVPESNNRFFRKDLPDRTYEFVQPKGQRNNLLISTKGGVRDTVYRK
ncbi:serine hydrolase domain-containing protein [Pedobacter lithocola]